MCLETDSCLGRPSIVLRMFEDLNRRFSEAMEPVARQISEPVMHAMRPITEPILQSAAESSRSVLNVVFADHAKRQREVIKSRLAPALSSLTAAAEDVELLPVLRAAVADADEFVIARSPALPIQPVWYRDRMFVLGLVTLVAVLVLGILFK